MKTGFTLWSFSHKEKPIFITGNSVLIAGIPVMKTDFSLWEKLHRENPVFITGMGLQWIGKRAYICWNHAQTCPFKVKIPYCAWARFTVNAMHESHPQGRRKVQKSGRQAIIQLLMWQGSLLIRSNSGERSKRGRGFPTALSPWLLWMSCHTGSTCGSIRAWLDRGRKLWATCDLHEPTKAVKVI